MKTSFANEPAYRAPTKTTDDNDQSTDKSLKVNFVIPLETTKEPKDPDRKYLSVTSRTVILHLWHYYGIFSTTFVGLMRHYGNWHNICCGCESLVSTLSQVLLS